MIASPLVSASVSCFDFASPCSWDTATNIPGFGCKAATARLNCPSRTRRSDTTITPSNTFEASGRCSVANRWAVQAIESVFPDPAEC